MALVRPRELPESFWLPVIAAESQARLRLVESLSKHRYSDELNKLVISYAASVSDAFAQQASSAARISEYPLAKLDSAVNNFVDVVLHHLYFEVNHPSIRRNWPLSRGSDFVFEMKPHVMLQSWHRQYLAEIPNILASIMKPELALNQLAEKRRSFVQPRLTALGLNATGWADRAGVDPTVAYDYINGKSNPRPESRRVLAEALGVKPNELP